MRKQGLKLKQGFLTEIKHDFTTRDIENLRTENMQETQHGIGIQETEQDRMREQEREQEQVRLAMRSHFPFLHSLFDRISRENEAESTVLTSVTHGNSLRG